MSFTSSPRLGRHALVVVAAMLSLIVTGCTATPGPGRPAKSPPPTSSTPSAPSAPRPRDVPEILDASRLRLPLDAYLPTLREESARSAAEREATRRCMQRFDITISLPEPPADLGIKSRNERRYGITDPVAAAELGYGVGERDPGAAPRLDEKAPPLKPRDFAVLTGSGASVPRGVPKGGCQGEVQRQLALVDPSTGKKVDELFAYRLSLESFRRSQDDSLVTAANADWSSCMGGKGHEYQKPLDPPADPSFRSPGSERERQTAKDDVACKRSTNLVGRWYSVEAAYQTKLVHDHKSELAALARASEANRRLVRTLLRHS